jgi:Xaa-Pro dipeptidase
LIKKDRATMPQIDYRARQQALLRASELPFVALVPGANMIYFTGWHFHLSERPTIAFISAEGCHIIVPELEATKLDGASFPVQTFVWNDTDGYQDAFAQAVQTLGLQTGNFGVDGQTMRVFEWLALQTAGAQVEQVRDMGKQLLLARARKTPAEVEAIQEAINISERALKDTLKQVQVGMTEREIAGLLNDALSAHGSEGNAFGALVLIGEKSALPHGNTGERVLQEGDTLLIDFGGMKHGYPADITRTFFWGEGSEELKKIHAIVARANEAARAIAAPGVPCGEVDHAARQVIEEAGYGEYFTHRTGHGLGLEVHELPQIASGVEDVLEVGMVFTIEPGIYLPNVGGVRIEDDMLITEDGARSLTSFPRGATFAS